MHFYIKFVAPKKRSLIVNLTDSGGTDIIKDIQNKLKKNVPPSRIDIDTSCLIDKNSYLLSVPDDRVFDIDKFAGIDMIICNVPEGFLGRYWDMVITEKPMGILKPSEYFAKYELNEQQLLDDYIADGCPTNWYITDTVKHTANLYKIQYKTAISPVKSIQIYAASIKDAIVLFENVKRDNIYNITIISVEAV